MRKTHPGNQKRMDQIEKALNVSRKFLCGLAEHRTALRTSAFLNRLLLAVFLLLPFSSFADLPKGSWSIVGEITHLRRAGVFGGDGINFKTNTLSLRGYYENGHFLVDLMPIEDEANIAETAGWDGDLLRLIHRYSDEYGKGLPRDQSLGYVEPSVFSRYATPGMSSVLLTFADSNALARLESGQETVILGTLRKYPEEESKFTVRRLSSGELFIASLCPGQKVEAGETVPVPGFEKGFTRWTHKSNLASIAGANGPSEVLVEYEQFGLLNGRRVPDHRVTGKILFSPADRLTTDFCPKITESTLRVRDYSGRRQLFPFDKGIMDQAFTYRLTNFAWDFDRQIVTAHFAELKGWLSTNEIPEELVDKPRPSLHPRGRIRVLILSGMIGFSVFSVVALFRLQKKSK